MNNDLSFFNSFIPCGMENLKVNSISNILNSSISVKEVAKKVSISMSEILKIPIPFKTDINNEMRALEQKFE